MMYRLLGLTILTSSILLVSCADNSNNSTTQHEEYDKLMEVIETTTMAQCQDLFKTLVEIKKVDASKKTTDAICRCQVHEMMKEENMVILADYYQNKTQSKAVEDMMQKTMTSCAERYYVKLDLWD